MGKISMNFKKIITKVLPVVAVISLAFPAAVFAAAPSDWVQRFDITVVEPGTVANYIQRYRITIEYPVHLSLATTEVAFDATANTEATGKTKATVRTAWNSGYKLFVRGDSALECKDDDRFSIQALSTAGALGTNTWGIGVGPDESTPPSSWSGVSSSDQILTQKTPLTEEVSDGYDVFFGVKVDQTMMACEYTGDVTFTALKY